MTEISPSTIKQLVEQHNRNNGLIVEIGCSDGETTKVLLSSCRKAHVHAFEPDPRATIHFHQNIRAATRCTFYESAVCDHVGTVNLHQSDGRNPLGKYRKFGSWHRNSSLLSFTPDVEWLNTGDTIEVHCTTFDDWAKETLQPKQSVDLLWLSVNGAEKMFVAGASEFLCLVRYICWEPPALATYDGQPTAEDVAALLPGFVTVKSLDNCTVFRNTAGTAVPKPPEPQSRPLRPMRRGVDQRPSRELNASDVRKLIDEYHTGPATILEIGANDGIDTLKLITASRKGHVHCFECDPRAIERWKHNVTSKYATLHEFALSDSEGWKTFHPSGGDPPGQRWIGYGEWDKSGSLLPFDRHKDAAPWMEYLEEFDVLSKTLDVWAEDELSEDVIIDLVWMDVQGAEGLVIQGGINTMQRCRFVYAECDPRPNYRDQVTKQDLTNMLDGFKLLGEYPGYNLLFKNESLPK